MPTINNIPNEMITEHVNWHTRPGNPSAGGRSINPFPPMGRRPALGSGEEFLVWHQGFLERFNQWVNSLPTNSRPDEAIIEPWRAIPQMIKMSMLGWNSTLADEEQLLSDMSNFESLDELGRFLEFSLHGYLHNASSSMWNEPILLSFESPRSSYFWQLHSLIELWRQQWSDQQQPIPTPAFTILQIDGAETQTTIGTSGETDRYQFTVATTSTLTIETTGPSDVVITVVGPDNPQRSHSSDDDGGQNFNARIQEQFTPGTYFVYVVFYDRSQTGNYGISVVS